MTTRLPVGAFVEFTFPRPVASSKNRKRIFGRGARKIVLLSREATNDIAALRTIAMAAANGREFHEDDSLSLTYEHVIATDELRIRVEKVGELPPRGGRVKRGTKRDVHGMVETIADALQGVLYPNDNAIDVFGGRRIR